LPVFDNMSKEWKNYQEFSDIKDVRQGFAI
jgi:hypothetical protein